MRTLISLLMLLLVAGSESNAQQKIGFVDSEYILQQLPEYASVQQNIDRLAQEWEAEMETMQQVVDDLFREYQARELLYTNEERKRKQEEIIRKEEEIEQFRMRYFGPEGELFQRQDQLMRPIQERVLEAVEEVALSEGYDYIFDKTGEMLFLYSKEQYDVSIFVLEELGIDTEKLIGTGGS